MYPNIPPSCGGWCRRCRCRHTLPPGAALGKAMELMRSLEKTGEIFADGEPPISTDPLFGEARGKMFGVLECLAADGSRVWFKAFSGQLDSRWLIPGWAPPLFDVSAFNELNTPIERQIKALGREIAQLPAGSPFTTELNSRRRVLSRKLMADIHRLYRISNFRGESATLDEAFATPGSKPTGTGDCCAPKLLNQAALAGLAPLSLAEFFFGRQNRSRSRVHGSFCPPCPDKCEPLLGFMLCGAEQRRIDYGG